MKMYCGKIISVAISYLKDTSLSGLFCCIMKKFVFFCNVTRTFKGGLFFLNIYDRIILS